MVKLKAQNMEYTDLEFGRISVGGREHVWARYQMTPGIWAKQYLIVLGGIGYAITASCKGTSLAQREKVWDAIAASFRLLSPVDGPVTASGETYRDVRTADKMREMLEERLETREAYGQLYVRAYEAVAERRYSEARVLLEKCLREDPDHVLAHKELAVVLKAQGDMRGALRHRREVKRLDPADTINRANLTELLAGFGAKREALREADELLALQPGDRAYQKLRTSLVDHSRPNFQIRFFCSMAFLIVMNAGSLAGWEILKEVGWVPVPFMLLATFHAYKSGPWVGIPKKLSALMAVALLLSFVVALFFRGYIKI